MKDSGMEGWLTALSHSPVWCPKPGFINGEVLVLSDSVQVVDGEPVAPQNDQQVRRYKRLMLRGRNGLQTSRSITCPRFNGRSLLHPIEEMI